MLMWLRRRGVRKDLSGIKRQARVLMLGEVASADRVMSPVTGRTAALFRWELVLAGSVTHGAGEPHRPFAAGTVGDVLEIRSGDERVAVPLSRAEVRLSLDPASASPLPAPIPDHFRDLIASAPPEGRLLYMEAALEPGDPVWLSANVVPVEPSPTSRPGAPRFAARPGLGPILLADQASGAPR